MLHVLGPEVQRILIATPVEAHPVLPEVAIFLGINSATKSQVNDQLSPPIIHAERENSLKSGRYLSASISI